MSDLRPVSLELYHEIEQFLFREARLLNNEEQREWLENVLDPQIVYRMVIHEDRFRRDKTPRSETEVMPYDDDYASLELRVRQFETGLRSMLDPPERVRRFVTNVEAYHSDKESEFMVLSNGTATRFRRLYEQEQIIFGRVDVLKKGPQGLRVLNRRIEMDQRVSVNKNLLFFV